MFKNILIPIDLSEKSLSAAKRAVQIAHQFNSKLIILNVQEDFMDKEEMEMLRVSVTSLKEKFRNIAIEAKNEISDILDVLHVDDVDVDILLREGVPSSEIIKLSKEKQVDMIVMGTNGRNSLQDIILGSTSHNVIRLSTCPVLVVPN